MCAVHARNAQLPTTRRRVPAPVMDCGQPEGGMRCGRSVTGWQRIDMGTREKLRRPTDTDPDNAFNMLEINGVTGTSVIIFNKQVSPTAVK